MMKHYLIKLQINSAIFRRHRLQDTYSLHRMVYDMFEDVRHGQTQNSSGLLWSLEEGTLGMHLLIMSNRRPREQGMIQPAENFEIKEIPEILFDSICYRFRITVNPVRNDSKSHKRTPVKGAAEIKQWFCSKAHCHGMAVNQELLSLDKVRVDTFRAKHQVTLQKATLSGVLEVTDRDLFKKSVLNGIGHGRSFGCGLLQVVPI